VQAQALSESERVKEWARQFERDGFLALRGYFPADEIDRAIAATDETLRTRAAEVVVDDLAINERTFLATARDPQNGRFKYNDLYLLLEELRSLALAPELSALLTRMLGGRTPVLCYSLTFVHGSGQPIHIDSLYMTPKTQSHLLATWIALEDVHPDAGPLVYYPRQPQDPSLPVQRWNASRKPGGDGAMVGLHSRRDGPARHPRRNVSGAERRLVHLALRSGAWWQ